MTTPTKRQHFETGAVRDSDDNKVQFELLSIPALWRLGDHLTRGARTYAPRNWEKGIPYMRVVGSLLRHLFKWLLRMDDEDHLAAILCNAVFLAHFDTLVRLGSLPGTLDDRPSYGDALPRALLTTLARSDTLFGTVLKARKGRRQ